MSDENRFHDSVIERLNEATNETGHTFLDLHKLINEQGAVDAARLLISPGSVGTFTYGFRVLAKANLLHLSIEQAVLDFESTGLFTDAQVSKARAHLAMARMMQIGQLNVAGR